MPIETCLAKHIVAEADQFMIHPNGLAYHICQSRTKHLPNCQRLTLQLILPEKYRLGVLLAFHNQMCHQFPELVLKAIRDRYLWYKMATQIYQHVKQYRKCQFSKHQSIPNTTPLCQCSPITITFMEWHIDIGEVVKASDTGYNFFLIAVDRFSQLVELHPLRSQTAKEVATVIYSQIYCRYCIGSITTD